MSTFGENKLQKLAFEHFNFYLGLNYAYTWKPEEGTSGVYNIVR